MISRLCGTADTKRGSRKRRQTNRETTRKTEKTGAVGGGREQVRRAARKVPNRCTVHLKLILLCQLESTLFL